MDDLIGQPLDRIDGRVNVTGRAVYAYEHDVANAAYAVLVVSTIANGRIASIDTRHAEQAPGVLLVMTHRNSPKLPRRAKLPEPTLSKRPWTRWPTRSRWILSSSG